MLGAWLIAVGFRLGGSGMVLELMLRQVCSWFRSSFNSFRVGSPLSESWASFRVLGSWGNAQKTEADVGRGTLMEPFVNGKVS